MSAGAAHVTNPTQSATRTVFRRSRWGALVGCLMLGSIVGVVLWFTWPTGYPLYETGRPIGLPTLVRLGVVGAWLVASLVWLRPSRFEIVLDASGLTDGLRDAAWSDIDTFSLKRLAGIPVLVVHLRDERRELEVPLAGVSQPPEEVLATVQRLLARARERAELLRSSEADSLDAPRRRS